MPTHAEANLSALIESSDDPIWSVDTEYRLLTFNRAFARAFQQSFGIPAVARMGLEDFARATQGDDWIRLYDRALHQGPFRSELRTAEGKILELSLHPILQEGRATGVSVFSEDVTESRRAVAALQAAEKRYRDLFDGAIEGMFQTSLLDHSRTANLAVTRMLGYDTPDELIAAMQANPEDAWLDPSERARYRERLHREGSVQGYECQWKRKDGQPIWVSMSSRLVRDEQGRPISHEGFVKNITKRKMAELQLRNSEVRYRTIFQTMLDAVVIGRSSDGAFLEVNEAFLRMTGYSREEVVGRTAEQVNIFSDPGDIAAVVQQMEQQEGFRDLEICFRRKTGELFWGLISASSVELDGVPCFLSVTRDISAAKAAEETIRDLAFFDPLTRLANRRLLLDRMQQALTTSTRIPRKMALLFVDLDHFKVLNDTLGHHTGDLMLNEVAQRLSAAVRESDTVARLGGDEFVVALGNLSGTPEDAAAQAKSIAEKIAAAIGKPFHFDGRQWHSQCSIGIAVFGTPHQDPAEIVQQAEIAMYQAKAAGRGAVRFFSPALQAAVNLRAALEVELRRAIREQEFELFYQPQVDAAGLIGAEVLLRWNHPQRGMLAPGEFIPLAEETGLILALGKWTLEAACRQLADWAQPLKAVPFSLAVNISAREFRQTDFVERVLAALAQTGANPDALKLELTESMLVEDVEDVIAKMSALRSRGLSFSLDDFGTGYSSLSYLKRLPLDQLKIDRAFVRDILSDVSSGAIAQTVVSLGKAMGLTVVAEGVETAGQRDYLTGLGCSSFQGYLFSRPLPAPEFERLWLAPSAAPVSAA